MNKVLILLSTYNGERFLKEQLDSLYAQEGVEIHILVRDDGSKDNTLCILENYQRSFGKMTIIKGIENIGVGPSFYALIKEAVDKYVDYDYYAFSDQDDVWLNCKCISGVKAINRSSNHYKLYISSSITTDASLRPISSSTKFVNSIGANLVANHIIGCSMLFNKALLIEINKINTNTYKLPNGKVPIHDAWAAIVAYSIGADVIRGSDALMYYRQHEKNTIGSRKSFFSMQYSRIKRYLFGNAHLKVNKSIIALQVLGDSIMDDNKKLMLKVANYRTSLNAKKLLLIDKRMYEYGVIDNIGTFLVILFNKF